MSNFNFLIFRMLREKRISVLMNVNLKKIEGINKVEQLIFNKQTQNYKDRNTDFFLRPDIIIAENGLGEPKYSLREVMAASITSDQGDMAMDIGMDHKGLPSSNIRFSLHYNDIHSPIFAAGSCT